MAVKHEYPTVATSDRQALQRILERMAVRGWMVTMVHDGEEVYNYPDHSIAAAIADATAVEECGIRLEKDGVRGSLFCVFGNSPWEVVADSSYFDGWNEDLMDSELEAYLEEI